MKNWAPDWQWRKCRQQKEECVHVCVDSIDMAVWIFIGFIHCGPLGSGRTDIRTDVSKFNIFLCHYSELYGSHGGGGDARERWGEFLLLLLSLLIKASMYLGKPRRTCSSSLFSPTRLSSLGPQRPSADQFPRRPLRLALFWRSSTMALLERRRA